MTNSVRRLIRGHQFSLLAVIVLHAVALNRLATAGHPVPADPIVIAKGQGTAPMQPQSAIDPAGTVHVVFGQSNEVWYCRSRNDGTGYTTPTKAFAVPNMSLGMRRGPRIVALKNRLIITAIGGPQGKGRDGDILSWTSQDGGETWAGPVRVNDVEASAREGLHAMAGGQLTTGNPQEVVWTIWLDLRNKRTEICGSSSIDGGLTWSPNRILYTNPQKSVCECCHPSITIDGRSVHVLFRNSLDGNRDMFVMSSVDGGRSFGTAVPAGRGHWKLNACPMDGGMLAAAGGKTPVAVWRREGNIYLGTTGDAEQLLGPGDQPWIAAASSGPAIAWTAGKTRDLMLQKPGSTGPELVARETGFPVLTAGKQGERAILIWEQRDGGQQTIQVLDVVGGLASRASR